MNNWTRDPDDYAAEILRPMPGVKLTVRLIRSFQFQVEMHMVNCLVVCENRPPNESRLQAKDIAVRRMLEYSAKMRDVATAELKKPYYDTAGEASAEDPPPTEP